MKKYVLTGFSNSTRCLCQNCSGKVACYFCFKFLALLFNITSCTYIVDKMQVNIQELEHNLRQLVKTGVLSMTSIFWFMNY